MLRRRLLLPVCLCLSAFAGAEGAESPAARADATEPSERGSADATSVDMPVYIPASRGATSVRTGAATRSFGAERAAAHLIAPVHTGRTSEPSPTLYWHLSAVSDVPVMITLIDPRAAEPLLALELPPPVPAGLHALALSDHGVELETGADYRWQVALRIDPQRPARDRISAAGLRHEPAPDVGRNLHELAAAGLWYDTFALLQRQLDLAEAEERRYLQRVRGSLLQQIDLAELGL